MLKFTNDLEVVIAESVLYVKVVPFLAEPPLVSIIVTFIPQFELALS